MKLKLLNITGLAISVLLGYAVAGSFQIPGGPAEVVAPDRDNEFRTFESRSYGPSLIVAQAYSTKCATSKGTCTLEEPREVGSRCECPGKGTGRVVR